MTTNRRYYISLCRYYGGESSPPKRLQSVKGGRALWQYEKTWVDWFDRNNSMSTSMIQDIRTFRLTTAEDDLTPLSLKALLLNRYLNYRHNDAPLIEELRDFESWYTGKYQSARMNG